MIKYAHFLMIFCWIQMVGQNQTSKWAFGYHAYLDFLGNPSPNVGTSSIVAWEGAASIADATGNLLFYTSGDTVWNKSHQPMANGTGLMGHKSAVQHLIVKQPGSASMYYIFTNDQVSSGPSNGFRYSVVDMSLAAGSGSVVVKNVLLFAPTEEKVAAVNHCNNNDIWIVAHGGSQFNSFLLSSSGINTVAVQSSIGPALSVNVGQGQLKISPTGKKMAMCAAPLNYYSLFDFDNATGIVSNFIQLPGNASSSQYVYSCEFSPDGSKLYGINPYPHGYLYQWDLCAGSASAVIASKDSVVSNRRSLQLAQDGKIYAIRDATLTTVGVINNPNSGLSSASYVDSVFSMNHLCFSFPSFLSSYFRQDPVPFTHTLISCGQVDFTTPPALCSAQSRSISSYQWLFGDAQSGTANTSSLMNSSHNYLSPGIYTVGLVLGYGCGNDTLKQIVNVTNVPTIGVAGNFTICKGQQYTYTASGASSYSWNSVGGPIANVLSPTVTSVYHLTGTSNGCIGGKTFTITVKECLGLMEQGINQVHATVYPNPGAGLFNLQTSANGNLLVFDATGRLIIESVFAAGNSEIDLRSYGDGIYSLQLTTPEGKTIFKLSKLN